MSAREEMLATIRKAAASLRDSLSPDEPANRPVVPVRYDDPRSQFGAVLESVGGRLVEVADEDAVAAVLAEQTAFRAAAKIAVPDGSLFTSGLPPAAIDLSTVINPHDLADVDYAVVRGEFAVAENGAVWCRAAAFGPHRVLPFIAQHLAIVVSPATLVHNLHEAYDRLAFEGPDFGLFISGPSKTADIEQSLVIGAHGARSLVVVLVGS